MYTYILLYINESALARCTMGGKEKAQRRGRIPSGGDTRRRGNPVDGIADSAASVAAERHFVGCGCKHTTHVEPVPVVLLVRVRDPEDIEIIIILLL